MPDDNVNIHTRQIKSGMVEYLPTGLRHHCFDEDEEQAVKLPANNIMRRVKTADKPPPREFSSNLIQRGLNALGHKTLTTKEWALQLGMRPSNCAKLARHMFFEGLVDRMPSGMGLSWRRKT